MADITEFEPLLKEVVQAKRLSASKMQKLTGLAMKCMEHDTQMVSTLYRTHKSLQNTFKISSLYVFDALARAAKSKAVKQGLSAEVSSQTGNPATFLSKLGGVVEGLFRDMVTSDIPESKAKTKKVLDIWVKGSTFPADQLATLAKILEGEKKDPVTNGVVRPPTPELFVPPTVTSIPPVNAATPVPQTPQDANPQVALLALLAQAANTNSLQTNVNIPAAPFGAIQLAALQQLTANVAPAVPNVSLHTLTSATAPPHPQGNSFTAGPNHSSRSPIPDDPRRPNRDDSRRERPISPEAGRSNDYRSDPRSHTRDPRTSRDPRVNARGHGSWGDQDRRRWDDRDGPARERDRNYRGRSRSRSPPSRFAGGRHEKVFSPARSRSPPRRGDAPPSAWSNNNNPPRRVESAQGVTKDEFGRDIRADSPSSSTPTQQAAHSPIPPAAAPAATTTTTQTSNGGVVHKPGSVAPITSLSNTQPSTTPVQFGMESFDFSTFDLTSPASWEALGKMWEVTYGCSPRGDQLMQFVMSLSMGAMGMAPSGGDSMVAGTGQGQGQWGGGGAQDSGKQSWGMDGRGNGHGMRGRGRGRGGGFHGNGRDNHRAYNGFSSNQDTDAIVLGGGDDTEVHEQGMAVDETPAPVAESTGGGLGGKMQKVGDKWVFVRNV